jgi:hypothetical protein
MYQPPASLDMKADKNFDKINFLRPTLAGEKLVMAFGQHNYAARRGHFSCGASPPQEIFMSIFTSVFQSSEAGG